MIATRCSIADQDAVAGEHGLLPDRFDEDSPGRHPLQGVRGEPNERIGQPKPADRLPEQRLCPEQPHKSGNDFHPHLGGIHADRVGARLLRALRTVGNPDHGGAESGEVVFYASPGLGVNFRFCRCCAA
jgi:hypothetical protein